MTDTKFIDGIDNSFSKKLRQRNIQTPTAIQKIVIPYILDKRGILFRSQTGTGKTFAYLIPVLQNIINSNTRTSGCRALIISPTLELCSQIKNEIDFLLDGLEIDGRPACEKLSPQLISGSGNIDRQIEGIRKNKPAVISANMGRLSQLLRMKKIKLDNVEYLIFDEADRIIAEEYSGEAEELLKNISPDAVKIGCSATLPQKIRLSLSALLGTEIILESDEQEILRDSILHWALWAEDRDKINTLRSFLSAARPKKALVFSDRAASIEEIVSKLNHHKYNSAGLYSGMDKNKRKNALRDFRSGKTPILAASDLAARGLDIENITHIITMSVSEDSDVYIHRAGRSARAGKKGVMVSIGNEKELRSLRSIEKKLGIVVYPKILYKGRICSPEEFELLE